MVTQPPVPYSCLRTHAEGALLLVLAQPRASRTEIAGPLGDALKIRVTGAPVEGQANAELCRFLAKALGIRKSAIDILRGDSGRHKQILLRGLTPAAAARRLGLTSRVS